MTTWVLKPMKKGGEGHVLHLKGAATTQERPVVKLRLHRRSGGPGMTVSYIILDNIDDHRRYRYHPRWPVGRLISFGESVSGKRESLRKEDWNQVFLTHRSYP